MWRDLLKYGAVGAAVWFATGNDVPALPAWSGLVVMSGLLIVVAMAFASGRLDDLLPDPPRVRLVCIRDDDTEAIEEWDLSPEQFAEADVRGQLNPLPECKQETYEVRYYDADRNVIRGNWRGSIPSSKTAGRQTAKDALDAVEDLRGDLEPQARYGERLQRHLPSIVRTLDRLRAVEQNKALSPHLTPSVGDGKTVNEVVQDQMPEELLPERMQADETESETTGRMDPEDRGESLVRDLASLASVDMDNAATDGGTDDD
jgi:hypothetical protein